MRTYAVDETGMDVILLIDISGSMRFTDPNRAALEAVGNFIDRLPVGVSRVGVIGFSGVLRYVIPLTPIDSPELQAELREQIARFQYTGFTDIGMALLTAADMLIEAYPLKNPMILLTSDGFIQISPNQPHRTTTQSYADVELALDRLDSMVPIYTIGIHNPTGVDADLLEMIASLSNAEAHFIDDANKLPMIFDTIYDSHVERIASLEELEEPFTQEEIDEEIEPEVEETDAGVLDENLSYVEPGAYLVATTQEDDTPLENDVYANRPGVLLYVLAIFSALTAAFSVVRLFKVVL